MSKKGTHYVKKSAKKYLTARDRKLLIISGIALIIAVAAFLIFTSLTDDSIEIRDGKAVGAGENWIIAGSGSGDKREYHKYGEYDFSAYDGEVVPDSVSYDDIATCVELFPTDGRYASAYVYGGANSAEETIENVSSQIEYMLENGEVHTPEEFMDGYIYWYTADITSDDGTVTPTQIFSAYLPAENDGCIILRVTYESEFVDAETGYAELSAIAKQITRE